MNRATGIFDVKLEAMTPYENSDGARIGRTSIDKIFKGELEATSKGEMLSAGTAIRNSAGYVAIERVVGTLAGRAGSFVLQHSGIMDRGTPHLIITVVPDSGTDQLSGIHGTMKIIVEGGKHSYEFDYKLP